MTVAALLAGVAPSPSPSDVEITPGQAGSPGFLGFVVTFLLAVAAIALFLSLTKQLRIVDRRARQLGLDDAGPDRGTLDAGAAGPDLEVDADVDVALRDVDPEDRGPGSGSR